MYRSQFRIPQLLYERLKEAADRNKRSVNAELVARLEASFQESSESSEPSSVFAVQFDELVTRVMEEVLHRNYPATNNTADSTHLKRLAKGPRLTPPKGPSK